MSGACYADGLLGKPAGEPGLAEYFSDVDGVCVKDSSYVTCPDLTCCDIDALARFSYRATRERPLPAAPRRSRARFSESPPTLRDLLPVFPRPAADRPSPSLRSFFGGVPILPESAGYGIVLGFGLFFSIFTTTLVRPRCPNRRQLFRRRTSGFPRTHFSTVPEKPSLKVYWVRSASDFSRNRLAMSTCSTSQRKKLLRFFLLSARGYFFRSLRRRSSDGKKTPPH